MSLWSLMNCAREKIRKIEDDRWEKEKEAKVRYHTRNENILGAQVFRFQTYGALCGITRHIEATQSSDNLCNQTTLSHPISSLKLFPLPIPYTPVIFTEYVTRGQICFEIACNIYGCALTADWCAQEMLTVPGDKRLQILLSGSSGNYRDVWKEADLKIDCAKVMTLLSLPYAFTFEAYKLMNVHVPCAFIFAAYKVLHVLV